MHDIKEYNLTELTDYLVSIGEKPFRAKQLFEWLHKKHVTDYDAMLNIPKTLKSKLDDFTCLKTYKHFISEIDGTEKYLFQLNDGNIIESVLMFYEHGLSVCVSSQVGCRMGCSFCASTLGGLIRNLTAAEILDQIYRIQFDHPNDRISHVVIMGSGEPLDNYYEFVRFIRLITDENGFNLSRRNITVSTCGLVENILRLADEDLGITLAVSLHAPNDNLRKKIMPIANKYRIDDILNACRYYFEKTGRRITFEYSLISGVNDSIECARELCSKIKNLGAHVNLIPVNPVEERGYAESKKADIASFKNFLEKSGINATIRREMGRDISGACGQLRRHYVNRES